MFSKALVLVLVIGAVSLAGDACVVSFNTKSLKYHSPTCEWALKCTRNCVTVPQSEAIAAGGVPCKVCKGRCRVIPAPKEPKESEPQP